MYTKKIVMIGTGGTIAGKGQGASNLTEYQAGSIGIEELLQAVPGLEDYGPFESIQFSNIDSSDMSPHRWVQLACLVNEVIQRDEVAGVVITHGTDTMEETSYFLHLTVHTDKPVVMTGSMRPATALSADGPVNVLQAVQVARSEAAQGKGVLVVMNSMITSARDVTKLHTTDVATFGHHQFGHLGAVQQGKAYFYYQPERRHTKASEFHVNKDTLLPRVDIVTVYAGIDEDVIEFYTTRADGLVIAGFGHGTLPQSIQQALKGVHIPKVRSSRIGNGIVSSASLDSKEGFVVSDSLTPVKARILLMLALQQERSLEELNHLFEQY